jgi:hypothetical protein
MTRCGASSPKNILTAFQVLLSTNSRIQGVFDVAECHKGNPGWGFGCDSCHSMPW